MSRSIGYRLAVVFVLSLTVMIGSAQSVRAGNSGPFHVEVEPIAYVLDGAGIFVGRRVGEWQYTAEALTLELPGRFHNQESFDDSELTGLEFHAEKYLNGEGQGWFLGPEVGITELEVTHTASGTSEQQVNLGTGVRGGYKTYLGNSSYYVRPVGGITLNLTSEDITIKNDTYENGPVGFFLTVGIGRSF
ncbi:MAG: hypothetical protein ABEK50_05130 [bacterium]